MGKVHLLNIKRMSKTFAAMIVMAVAVVA